MTAPLNIVGAGAFGTALAIAYGRAGHPVTLWARDRATQIQTHRENTERLPGAKLPETVAVTDDLSALRADITLMALPTQVTGAFLAADDVPGKIFVSTAKGIDRATGAGPTSLISRAYPTAPVAQLTGPSFAVEIAQGLPTALTLACTDEETAQSLQTRLSTPALRLYRTTDVVGAELGGALKNVMAIAAGALRGAGLGESLHAAMIARGFAEMRRVAVDAGALEETLTGLSGLGDLVLTCGSDKSRNYRFGFALARGETVPEDMTVEGLHTAREIAARGDVDTPIADAVAALSKRPDNFDAILEGLFNRPLKQE
ncbi:MAG: NAD(P)H-dependent glycerol-3-phosphate dehydrogenase [Pseudomonadota bacterium]